MKVKHKNEIGLILVIAVLFLVFPMINALQKEKKDTFIDTQEIIRERDYYKEEYEVLLHELDIKDNISFDKVYAKVLERDTYHFFDEITINKGKKHGIEEKMAVISQNGLIGAVDEVRDSYARVKLITKKNHKISIVVNGAYGFLNANDKGELRCENLTHYNNITVGDKVYTSGIGTLPGKILVGIVDSLEDDTLGIEPQISIRSEVNLLDISIVAILKGDKK